MSIRIIEAKIVKKIKQTEDTFLFRLEHPMAHDPGQFVQASVLGIGEAPISICSYSDKFIELDIRAVGNVSNKLCCLEEHDRMLIRGPYGKGYPMKDMKNKNLIIIGGGTGVAPVRGVIEYVREHRRSFKNVNIFLGYRDPDNILFKEDIKEWGKIFEVHQTLDRAPEGYKGNIGLITKLLEDNHPSPKNTIAVICGPPIMIKFVIRLLKERKFKDSQIYISHERHMKCGIQKCGHCMIKGQYVCKDGPVFRYDQIGEVTE